MWLYCQKSVIECKYFRAVSIWILVEVTNTKTEHGSRFHPLFHHLAHVVVLPKVYGKNEHFRVVSFLMLAHATSSQTEDRKGSHPLYHHSAHVLVLPRVSGKIWTFSSCFIFHVGTCDQQPKRGWERFPSSFSSFSTCGCITKSL